MNAQDRCGGPRVLENLLDVEQPIIAAVNGDALGLGANIALLDVIVASETARIADTHVKVGIVVGDSGAVIWPILVGSARAKEFPDARDVHQRIRGQHGAGRLRGAAGLGAIQGQENRPRIG